MADTRNETHAHDQIQELSKREMEAVEGGGQFLFEKRRAHPCPDGHIKILNDDNEWVNGVCA